MNTDKIIYVAPSYEDAQNVVTCFSEDNVPLETSLHSDVSLLLRINSLDATTLSHIKSELQPMIDSSNVRDEFEQTFGSLTDDDLIRSCPSRYVQTASEKMSYMKQLAEQDKKARTEYAKNLKDKQEKERIERENIEFQAKLKEIFK